MRSVYDVSLINKICCELRIDANQFHLLSLLSMKERGKTSPDIELYKDKYRTHHPDKERYLIAIIKDLEEKGLIENLNYKDELYMYYNADFLHVTPKFTDYIYLDPEEMAQQLWSHYPKWLFIDGRKVSSRSNTSLDDLESTYSRIIKRDKKMHRKILRLIEEHYSEGFAEMGLDKFVKSQHWELLQDSEKHSTHGEDI